MAPELLTSPKTQLGEGPGYDCETDIAWWFDILTCRLFTLEMKSRKLTEIPLPGMASMMAITTDRRQLIAMDEGLWLRDPDSGALSLYIALNSGKTGGMRTNDGRVHPSGSIWISSMAHDPIDGAASIHLVRQGEARLLFSGLTIPNSICFSPDGAAGFFADTREGIIYRVPLDPDTGDVTGACVVFHDGRGRAGGIDGSVIDRDGCLWNARWGTGEIECITPSGHVARTVGMPFKQPTCPAFIGAQGQGMLVTSASVNLPDDGIQGTTMITGHEFNGITDAYVIL
ncbi:SMP-30/gluconolactonase/LRE family protein [Rhizobium hainanense]|uniref:Sugar lactone lactonase YvrE n=1 Tax=Rhizobium hainanense TaxID=52131 RepID=A0A1C3W8W6_9HYPH|nr:SMP-30/gluconolactonase/LRE family protein [Rhizobium hainanense]SCB36592.1 Sugar lactone lactonase YvrE [Rhizobium hainanense]